MTHSTSIGHSLLADKVLRAIGSVVPTAGEMVLLHRPYLPDSAWEYVKECLDTGWVSSAGAFVTRFEQKLAEVTGCRRAVAVVNGTAALQVCLHLAGVTNNDEVICPSLSFVATANAIRHCGAIPHFVDVSEERLSLAPDALRLQLQSVAEPNPAGSGIRNRVTGRRISAVVLMHCFGHPGAIQEVRDICDEYGLAFIEDAAESLGSHYQGVHTGSFGRLSAVSFNGNKILTTGGGGAILTNDDALADLAKHLTTTAKLPHAWEFEHDAVAWNYRMPNINAALGFAQLEILDKLIDAKRALAERYRDAFAEIEELNFLDEPADSRSNFWLNTLVLQPDVNQLRDGMLAALNQAGYQARPLWKPMHHLSMYADAPRGQMSVTESLYSRVINIPSSPDLLMR
jgi:perosamine synthetase